MSFARKLLVLPIRAYQRFLSPLKPPTCRFHPSCSHYAAGVIGTHGVLKGLVLGTWRILRCHPFSAEGPDPVPPPSDWRMPFRRGYRAAWLAAEEDLPAPHATLDETESSSAGSPAEGRPDGPRPRDREDA